MVHWSALISDSPALSQTPAEASGPWTRGKRHCAVCLFTFQLILIPNSVILRGAQCELAAGHGRGQSAARLVGLEPGTC